MKKLLVALAMVALAGCDTPESTPVEVREVEGCCTGVDPRALTDTESALRDGGWRAADWVDAVVYDGVRRQEGTVPAGHGLVASIWVFVVAGRATGVDIMGVDTTPDRAERVHAQVEFGEFGEAVEHVTAPGCWYDIDEAGLAGLLDRLATGGVRRVPTRLRVDYAIDADWPGLQEVDDRHVVSWRQGPPGSRRVLLAVEDTGVDALAAAASCLSTLE
jgi:hypothetical protein